MTSIAPPAQPPLNSYSSNQTIHATKNVDERFQSLNQKVEQAGYRECEMNEEDAKRWNVKLSYIYPSERNVVRLSDESTSTRPIHANRIQIAGNDWGIASILPHTAEQAEDFYRCILQEKIGAIINISQPDDFGWMGKFKYWPNPHPKLFGDIVVSQVEPPKSFKLCGPLTSSKLKVAISKLSIETPHEKKQCKFIHFPDWQDGHGLTTETLAGLVALTEATCKGAKPIIHCANGVGRTGTLFTALALSQTPSQTLKNADLVDQYIIEGRLSRNKDFVENKEQYKSLLDFAENKVKGQFTQLSQN